MAQTWIVNVTVRHLNSKLALSQQQESFIQEKLLKHWPGRVLKRRGVQQAPNNVFSQSGLDSAIGFRINENYEITSIWLVKHSGIALFDSKSFQAVSASSPLSESPEKFNASEEMLAEFRTTEK